MARITSYTIENSEGVLLDYTAHLDTAKLLAQNFEGSFITKLVGRARCEGIHKYYLQYTNGKFKKVKEKNFALDKAS